MAEPRLRKVLLLGSGLMSETVVDYLLKRKDNEVTIASNILRDAEKISSSRDRCVPKLLDVNDKERLRGLIRNSEVVISYVPAFLHPVIAEACLAENKSMITASYISKELAALNQQVIDKGLTFLNEIGFDPGIDHLATMKILDEVKQYGGKILEYESYGSGLPAPDCCDNPLGYKFTWSPIGALRALKNEAKFLRDGKIEIIPGPDLLYNSFPKEVNMALSLEGYPNRDSTQYIDLYGLHDAQSVMRGTLRYKGFSLIARSLIELGLFSEDPIPKDVSRESWRELLTDLLKDKSSKTSRLVEGGHGRIHELCGIDESDKPFVDLILKVVLGNHNYVNATQQDLVENGAKIIKAFKWLGLFSRETRVDEEKSMIESLCSLMQSKMLLQPGEKDCIIMFHRFKIQWGSKTEVRKSSLIAIGDKGRSAMSLVVGYPTGVAAQLFLDGIITKKGVIMPNTKDLYEPILELLAKEGIVCKEETE